jgi:hypothetical protein
MNNLTNTNLLLESQEKSDNKKLIKKFKLLLGPVIYLSTEFIVFSTMLVLMELFSYLNLFQSDDLLIEKSNIKDECVLREEQKEINDEIKEITKEENKNNKKENKKLIQFETMNVRNTVK